MKISQVSKTEKKQILLYIVIAICFLFISINTFNSGFRKMLDEEFLKTQNMYLYVVLLGIFGVSMLKKQYKKPQSITVILFLYSVVFLFGYNPELTKSLKEFIAYFALLLWIFSFKFGVDLSYWDNLKIKKAFLYFCLFVIIPIVVYAFILFIRSDIISIKLGGNDAVFVISAYLPFVFALKDRRVLKTILIFMFLILAALSFKRSIILAVLISLFFYIWLMLDKRVVSQYAFYIYLFVILSIGAVVYMALEDIVMMNVFDRFHSLATDGGSERDFLYRELFTTYVDSNFFHLCFGYGYKSTINYVAKMGHNDFINIMFDFGLMGIILYLSFIFKLIGLTIKKYRKRANYRHEYALYISILMFLFVLSSFNNMIYEISIVIPITFMLGFSYMQLKRINS